MVFQRDAAKRATKHSIHYDPVAIQGKLTIKKPSMDKKIAISLVGFTNIENQTRVMLEHNGVPHIYFHSYYNFTRELYSYQIKTNVNNLPQTVLRRACLLKDKWVARGLDETILQKIGVFFAIDLTQCNLEILDRMEWDDGNNMEWNNSNIIQWNS